MFREHSKREPGSRNFVSDGEQNIRDQKPSLSAAQISSALTTIPIN
jgi:hypothetical protein